MWDLWVVAATAVAAEEGGGGVTYFRGFQSTREELEEKGKR